MPSVNIMIKPASGRCNLRCEYCFYSDEMEHRALADRGIMTPETAKSIIRRAFIYADGQVTFTFQGGEPLLAPIGFYRDFVKTVSEYKKADVEVGYALQTNGTLLTDEHCAFFAEHGFLIGVSLDGPRGIHDAHRKNAVGEGSFDQVTKGIRLLKKHGVEFNILCVLTESSASRIKEIWKTLSAYGGVQFISCIDSLEHGAPHAISAESYGRALVEIFDLWEKGALSKRGVRERRMDNYLSILTGYPPEQCGMCGGCGVYFLVEADGETYPCDFYVLDEYRLGNINETSFMRMERSEVMRRFQADGAALPEKCSSCEYAYLCRGGCRRDRETPSGDNVYCESYRYFFSRRLERLKALAETAGNMRGNMRGETF